MRRTALIAACLAFASGAALAVADAAPPAPAPAGAADPAAPRGLLPDAATPSAYRLDFTIDPDKPRFSGHAEIDVAVKAATRTLYLHGRGLHVAKAVAIVGGREFAASYAEVDPTGVARLTFARPLPAGKTTFRFDYDAAFGDSPAGLYRINVGGRWYSWTQFESIDARAAFPSFDQPGYKTPFTISVTAKPGDVAVSNAPEAAVTRIGGMEKHQFAATKPLPTYLVALVTGPFVHPKSQVPPTPQRAMPLPLGVVATQAQAQRTDYVLAETPRIVSLLEEYFGQPFPFPKLDQIGSPVMPGAMENAGADIYGDSIIFLDPGAATGQKQAFGMIVAHELAHQWFGDLVSPAWWEDIWLNESFANWMGYRIGNAWRPELNIGVGAIAEGLAAMGQDALETGRPIHQPITQNNQIDSAFDAITYGKGGQVVAMIAAYMGDERFRDGVRLHLSRHMYGNARSEDFYQALADAAHDPRIVTALKSFTEQQGVPLVTFARTGDGQYRATQTRYAFLGSTPAPLTWTIPLCFKNGDTRDCQLLDGPSMSVRAIGRGPLMPNAGGQGYYRFDLPSEDWNRLIAAGATLSGGEALATTDSLWADFRAGTVPAALLIEAARAMAANPESNASVDGGNRLAGLRMRGLIGEAALPDYRRLMAAIYAPRLATIGFDPAAGAFASDSPDRQKLRQALVALVSSEARDPAIRAKLLAAGDAYLGGNAQALDHAYLGQGLDMVVERDGLPRAKALMERALASEDPVFRGAALAAVAGSGKPDVAAWLLAFEDKRLRSLERLGLLRGLVSAPETRETAIAWIIANYDRLAVGNGIFIGSRLPQMLGVLCSAARADEAERRLGPKVASTGVGELEFRRTIESVRHCGVLKDAKSNEIAAAIKGAAQG